MTIRFKKILAICFLIVVSFLFLGHVQAYVLQGAHVLELMIKQLGEAEGLFVSQQLIFYRMVTDVDIEKTETADDIQPPVITETELPAEQNMEIDQSVMVEKTLELEETLRFVFSRAFDRMRNLMILSVFLLSPMIDR